MPPFLQELVLAPSESVRLAKPTSELRLLISDKFQFGAFLAFAVWPSALAYSLTARPPAVVTKRGKKSMSSPGQLPSQPMTRNARSSPQPRAGSAAAHASRTSREAGARPRPLHPSLARAAAGLGRTPRPQAPLWRTPLRRPSINRPHPGSEAGPAGAPFPPARRRYLVAEAHHLLARVEAEVGVGGGQRGGPGSAAVRGVAGLDVRLHQALVDDLVLLAGRQPLPLGAVTLADPLLLRHDLTRHGAQRGEVAEPLALPLVQGPVAVHHRRAGGCDRRRHGGHSHPTAASPARTELGMRRGTASSALLLSSLLHSRSANTASPRSL